MLSTIYSFHGSLYSFPIRTLLSNCGHILHINSFRDFGLYFLHIDILGHTYNQESFYYKNGYSSQGETLVLLHCQCKFRFGRDIPIHLYKNRYHSQHIQKSFGPGVLHSNSHRTLFDLNK